MMEGDNEDVELLLTLIEIVCNINLRIVSHKHHHKHQEEE